MPRRLASRPRLLGRPAPESLANIAVQPKLDGMNTIASKNLVMLARMLERLDRSGEPVDPKQYQGVVEHLAEVLQSVPHDAALEAVLQASPATAQLYENLHYEYAGLCRSALEVALEAEISAREAIDRARRRSAQPNR
jgi:hypothetical protein